MVYLCYFYSFTFYWCPTRTPYHMIFLSFDSNTTGATSEAWTANASGTHGPTPSFWWGSVTHLWGFLCCLFCFVCLSPVSCVLNVACFSGFSILDFPFGFLLHLSIRYINCSPLTITLVHLWYLGIPHVALPILFSFYVVVFPWFTSGILVYPMLLYLFCLASMLWFFLGSPPVFWYTPCCSTYFV